MATAVKRAREETVAPDLISSKRRRSRKPDTVLPLTAQPEANFRGFKGPLCVRCSGINFDDIFQRRLSRDGQKILSLGQLPSSLATSSCPLCRFLVAMRHMPKVMAELDTIRYNLAASLARLRFGASRPIRGLQDTVVLAVVPARPRDREGPPLYIWPSPLKYDNSQDNFVGSKLDGQVDYEKVKMWMDFCKAYHVNECVKAEPMAIPGFKVIDCRDRRIVAGPSGADYAALSYVWGVQSIIPPTAEQMLPKPCTRVIEDAITVIGRLEMRYLWIDQYCIDQNSEEDKHNQIQNMDSIFSGAKLTIIAAAGEDQSFGLPGVTDRTSRNPQPWVRVGNHLLVSSLPDPAMELKRSKWASRGWTYQEGLLSRQRLVFTPSQVYFQCMSMYCFESISAPLRQLHTKNMVRFRDSIAVYRAFPPRGFGKTERDLTIRVNEYLRRDLTVQGDSLKAFLGILHAYERAFGRVRHFWGVPLFDTRGGLTEKEFRKTFGWVTTTKLLTGLAWHSNAPLQRREGLPSWSWVGWRIQTDQGTSNEFIHFADTQRSLYEHGTLISAEHNDGTILEINSRDLRSDMVLKLSQRLHIFGWIRRFRFQVDERGGTISIYGGPDGNLADVFLDDRRLLNPDSDQGLLSDQCFCLLLGWCSDEFLKTGQEPVKTLILKRVRSNILERVGRADLYLTRQAQEKGPEIIRKHILTLGPWRFTFKGIVLQ